MEFIATAFDGAINSASDSLKKFRFFIFADCANFIWCIYCRRIVKASEYAVRSGKTAANAGKS